MRAARSNGRLGALALLSVAVGACQIVAGIDARSLGAADGGAGGGPPAPEAGSGDDSGGAGPLVSCAGGGGGQTTCGVAHTESCCATRVVPGGTFDRLTGPSPATVSSFALGRFEVTVGRFRAFADAVNGGWLPEAGSGKHAHLRGGSGLVGTGSASAPESGWDPAWSATLPKGGAAWSAALTCTNKATWDGVAPELPVVCETWFEAYAFCIWDGGFLPSEAEWGFAALAGSEERKYPWSVPPAATTIACTTATFDQCGGNLQPVGATPPGDGKWGQADLAGNVAEWTLDGAADYVTPCVDCANVTAVAQRSTRGGSYDNTATGIFGASRASAPPDQRARQTGFRCAYPPGP